MNPQLFTGNADSYPAPENSCPLFLESADQVTIPLVLLADDDASGSLESVPIGSTLWKVSFQKNYNPQELSIMLGGSTVYGI